MGLVATDGESRSRGAIYAELDSLRPCINERSQQHRNGIQGLGSGSSCGFGFGFGSPPAIAEEFLLFPQPAPGTAPHDLERMSSKNPRLRQHVAMPGIREIALSRQRLGIARGLETARDHACVGNRAPWPMKRAECSSMKMTPMCPSTLRVCGRTR